MIKLIKKIVQFGLLLFVFSCKKSEKQREEENFYRCFLPVIHQGSDLLKSKYGMQYIGFGIDAEEKFVNLLELSFTVNRELKKEEIRFSLVDMAYEFISVINSNEQISSYMENYPVDVSNIGIRIYFRHEDGTDIKHPGITMAALEDSGLIYKTLGEQYGYKDTMGESFEDALKIVEESRGIERGAKR
jgi:hypothetical protein